MKVITNTVLCQLWFPALVLHKTKPLREDHYTAEVLVTDRFAGKGSHFLQLYTKQWVQQGPNSWPNKWYWVKRVDHKPSKAHYGNRTCQEEWGLMGWEGDRRLGEWECIGCTVCTSETIKELFSTDDDCTSVRNTLKRALFQRKTLSILWHEDLLRGDRWSKFQPS